VYRRLYEVDVKSAGAPKAEALVSVPERLAASALSPQQERVLLVRLPCNPIFPIGPIYLADRKRMYVVSDRDADLYVFKLHDDC